MWTKICGITRTEDALIACRSGCDALGLNFYRPSKRYLVPAQAALMLQQMRREFTAAERSQGLLPDLVGVFVNSDCDEICGLVHEVGLTAVQCHGDESVDMLKTLQRKLPDIALIRAFRLSEDRLESIQTQIEELATEVDLSAVLLDTFVAGEFGGTGSVMSSQLVTAITSRIRIPWILAGGLTPDNVSQAIACTQPWGVDTASGVEDAPGLKNQQQMQAFLKATHGETRNITRLRRPGTV